MVFACVLYSVCGQTSPAAANDMTKQVGPDMAETKVRSAAAAMTTANAAAAALFDAVEDSDSSASSDMLQMSEVSVSDVLVD